LAVLDELSGDVANEVARDREADAGRGATAELRIGRGERRNADHAATQIDERAAGVAGIDRGARLHHGRQRVAVSLETGPRIALTTPSVTL
jgi:hypothetical protein